MNTETAIIVIIISILATFFAVQVYLNIRSLFKKYENIYRITQEAVKRIDISEYHISELEELAAGSLKEIVRDPEPPIVIHSTPANIITLRSQFTDPRYTDDVKKPEYMSEMIKRRLVEDMMEGIYNNCHFECSYDPKDFCKKYYATLRIIKE